MTITMAAVIGLTFLFGFGNVLALGLRLGVPAYIAPLVAPAVDLSVLGLLLGVRYLALNDAPREQILPARRLLVLASAMTLALNVTEPVLAGHYGKAAFDAVGPILLIGWAEVGPGLLQSISSTAIASDAEFRATDEGPQDALARPAKPSQPPPHSTRRSRKKQSRELDPELLQRARWEDARHREVHQRPISAETLRKRLGVGAKRSRALVKVVRAGDDKQAQPAQLPSAREEEATFERKDKHGDRVLTG
ncbi:SpdA protein [Streptomyces millisiae]|uniref:SpdA protein n=1 Tax=Streptomyces millisiae TaxID=3075542 RepID=A0ABU2LZP0_9ACTN|nr:SpdA protein [Streptomyces sp. DSM 44918]MDT0323055.1 SpdA protein [Streptomyces sp. DSM 44918]